MKNFFLSIFLLHLIISCKKVTCDCELPTVKLGFDSGNIVRTYLPINESGITDSMKLIVTNLFIKNGIDTNIFKLDYFSSYTQQSTDSPYLNINYKQVGTNQYYKGFRIFEQEVTFQFENDLLDSFSKTLLIPKKYKTIDTDSTLQLGQLRYLLLRDVEQFQHINNHRLFIFLRAEKGYYQTDNTTLFKSWLVSPLNSTTPNSIYYDSTGVLARYEGL